MQHPQLGGGGRQADSLARGRRTGMGRPRQAGFGLKAVEAVAAQLVAKLNQADARPVPPRRHGIGPQDLRAAGETAQHMGRDGRSLRTQDRAMGTMPDAQSGENCCCQLLDVLRSRMAAGATLRGAAARAAPEAGPMSVNEYQQTGGASDPNPVESGTESTNRFLVHECVGISKAAAPRRPDAGRRPPPFSLVLTRKLDAFACQALQGPLKRRVWRVFCIVLPGFPTPPKLEHPQRRQERASHRAMR